jgi:ABC-type multidrug transport system fused ATPase/permease subunit
MKVKKDSSLTRIFLDCLSILSFRDRRRYWLVVVLQAILGFLDLIGVLVMGLIGALAIRGVQSQPASPRVTEFLTSVGLSGITFQAQVAILGLIAALILIVRTFLTMYLSRRILRFLSARGALISSQLFSKFINQDLQFLQKNSSIELQFILGAGVSSISVGILGTASILVSDFSALLIIAGGLLVVDPISAFISIILFGSIALVLYFMLHRKAQEIGEQLTTLNILSNQIINQTVDGYREIYSRNRMHYFADELKKAKYVLADAYAANAFLPNIGKYVIEISIIFGAIGISAYQFIMNDSTHAVASLAIFLAAGTRIAPALLRLQQSLIAIKSNIGMATLTLDALKYSRNLDPILVAQTEKFDSQSSFEANVAIRNLEFSYLNEDGFKIKIDELDIANGETVAIVGPSGSGKSSLVDIILGVNNPNSGRILISDLPPKVAIQTWPGAVSYVPQEVLVIPGSISANVALGFPSSEIDHERVLEALKIAQLDEYALGSGIGDDNSQSTESLVLSGGQRQRLGIARAIYTQPKLLILDEATSALDGITEAAISDALNKLKRKVTIILIAHRLSTVMNADRVFYMDKGQILAEGTFSEVRDRVPNFDQQAKLMGL